MKSVNGVSAIILTKNEESNLPACLSSLKGWVGQIFVVDSGSSDGTVGICNDFGATVLTHDFETHSKQWQWALDNLPIQTEWVLGLDADQVVTAQLRDEICGFIQGPDGGDTEIGGAYLNRRQIFRGKWIRHGGYYPKYLLKLFRRGRVWSDPDDMVDHHFRAQGRTVKLSGDLIEDNQNERDISVWIQKHNRYARLQALEEYRKENGLSHTDVAGRLMGAPDERIFWLKGMWARCPLYIRPLFYFTYRYVLRLGFLDGKQGFIFHFLQALWYRLLVDIHLDELRRNPKAASVALSASNQTASRIRSNSA